ncbi:MAG: dTMP kinase [Pseudoalteromonas tetraodonis]|jgi:dTMP kinase
MSDNARGSFITIEGQDGAGKSTNVEVVQAYLQQHDIDFVHTREPGGTTFGEQVRDLLLGSGDDSLGEMAELLLVFAARAEHIKQVIEPALSQGKWVLCDRFTDATYAYQGGGRGMSMSEIAKLEQSIQGSLRPDLTLLLDLPVELGESRAGQRSEPDRFEKQQIGFKQKVRDCYLQRAAAEPKRIKLIDASQSLQDVKDQILKALTEFGGAHG